jgi:hypothetical protein
MTNIPAMQATDGVPTYLERGDPAGRFADYHPAWVDKMASDVTLEGSILDGAVQGAEAVRAVIAEARQLYSRQDFNFVGPRGDNAFIEDYTAEVEGTPVGAVHLVVFNAQGEAQHTVHEREVVTPYKVRRRFLTSDAGRISASFGNFRLGARCQIPCTYTKLGSRT